MLEPSRFQEDVIRRYVLCVRSSLPTRIEANGILAGPQPLANRAGFFFIANFSKFG